MMTRLLAVLLATLSISCPVIANAGDLKPYQGGDWSSIVKTAKGAPVAIHFWGVTCSVCVKELPQWGQFLATNPNVHLIFIQVDDVSAEMIQKMLAKANLSNFAMKLILNGEGRHPSLF
jgi:thiol-disulfide isomerase/thioredoxin